MPHSTRPMMFSQSSQNMLTGPPPPDTETLTRWNEGQRRRRLLEGLWKVDLRQALHNEFEPRRRRQLGMPDTTKNLFRSLITQLAVLYDRPPIVMHRQPQAVKAIEEIAKGAGLWQLAVTLQQQTLAEREGLYRLDVPEGSDKLLVRVVPSDLVWAEAPPDDPDTPELLYEYRLREDSKGQQRWTRDCFDIRDPANPAYRVETGDGKEDLSASFIGALSGDAYPYRWADGRPFIPYTLYHATRTGKLWDPFRGIELVDGTLTVAGLWTQWRHLVRDASWPQRWAINAVVDGLEINRETGDAAVTTDPSSLLNFRPKVPGQSSAVGQFAPGGDPLQLGQAIRDYSADLAQDFDLSPGDIKRTHSAEPRSGYAIEITREGQRAAQRRLSPQFMRGDVETISKIAALWNRAFGTSLPEDDWSIKYLGLPLSMEERRLIMEDQKMRAELGVTSKPLLLAAIEGITEDQARARLLEIQLDNATFDAGPPTPEPTLDEEST